MCVHVAAKLVDVVSGDSTDSDAVHHSFRRLRLPAAAEVEDAELAVEIEGPGEPGEDGTWTGGPPP